MRFFSKGHLHSVIFLKKAWLPKMVWMVESPLFLGARNQKIRQILRKLLLKDYSSNPDFPVGKLRLIDDASICLDGGLFSKGYAMASRQNSPTDWFYTNHFFQDPVMPGSLGIEAIVQAFKVADPFNNEIRQILSLLAAGF